eukprot:3692681-Amphidinium_carterae.1
MDKVLEEIQTREMSRFVVLVDCNDNPYESQTSLLAQLSFRGWRALTLCSPDGSEANATYFSAGSATIIDRIAVHALKSANRPSLPWKKEQRAAIMC